MPDQAVINSRRTGINWSTCITMVVFHAASIAALFMFTWKGLAAAALLWWISGSLGIGMGFHRLLTHRGFKTPKWVEYFLTICGMLTLESGAINWVATHRIHHSHTDAPGDPHTPRDGAWWAHIGWILTGTAQQHDEAILRRYTPDLMKDKVHVWLNKWFYLPLVVVGVLLFALGGWSLLMWGIFMRVTVGWHATWLVNSATHMWGTRRFETNEDSTNNPVVALLTFGEGWHNNHHAYPRAARHGFAWYELDVNWMGIRALQLLGLAHDIKLFKDAEPSVEDDASVGILSKAA
ncbi:MAG: fatty acid desaturase [Acidobacteria bacterium]|nr:fatty acid desaturase [Acidobacteriota bacterium]